MILVALLHTTTIYRPGFLRMNDLSLLLNFPVYSRWHDAITDAILAPGIYRIGA